MLKTHNNGFDGGNFCSSFAECRLPFGTIVEFSIVSQSREKRLRLRLRLLFSRWSYLKFLFRFFFHCCVFRSREVGVWWLMGCAIWVLRLFRTNDSFFTCSFRIHTNEIVLQSWEICLSSRFLIFIKIHFSDEKLWKIVLQFVTILPVIWNHSFVKIFDTILII